MARLTPVSGLSLADQAREAIRTAIFDGSFAPEERLTIEQLAAELGISRTPVREALKALEGDGLINLLPYRGAVVTPFARDELYHRYSIRAMLEGYAAELACTADAGAIADALEANCAELVAISARLSPDDADGIKRLASLNQEFHQAIHEGSRSATLKRLLGTLKNPLAFTLTFWGVPALRDSSIEIHTAIAAAFRNRQPQLARTLMEKHLLSARDSLMSIDDAGQWRSVY